MNPLRFIILADKVLKPFELFSDGFLLALDAYAISKAKNRQPIRRRRQTRK